MTRYQACLMVMELKEESNSGGMSESEYVRTRAASLLAKNDPDTFGTHDSDATTQGTEDEKVDDRSESVEASEDDGDISLEDHDEKAGEKEEDDDVPLDDEQIDSEIELDEELAKNPKLAKRWREQQKGLTKLVKRNEELNTEMGNFHGLMKALERPDSVEKALDFLTEQLSQLHGRDLKRSQNTVDNNDDLEDLSDGEYRVNQNAKRLAQAEADKVRREFAPERDELKRMRDERETRTQREATDKKISKAAPMVANRINAQENGFSVSEEMVRKAYDQFPEYRSSVNRLAEAVGMMYRKDIARHHLERVEAKANKRESAPDLQKSTKVPKGTVGSRDEVSMNDIISSLRQKHANSNS